MYMSANLSYFDCMYSVCLACNDHYPTEREVKGEDCQGGGGRVGGGKVNGQLSLVTSVGRKRMGKAPAVQSGRALPMGRCASPPLGYAFVLRSLCKGHVHFDHSDNQAVYVGIPELPVFRLSQVFRYYFRQGYS